MSFCEKIRLLRNEEHMSQEEFADLLEVSRQTVSKWELGVSFPEIEKLIFISDRFNVSIDYLLKDPTASEIDSDNFDRIVIRFLGSSHEMSDISERLIDIIKDGIIDDSELIELERISLALDSVLDNINRIKAMADSADASLKK